MGHLTVAIIGAVVWLAAQAVSRLGTAHPWMEGVTLLTAGLLLIGAGLASRRKAAAGEPALAERPTEGAAAGLAASSAAGLAASSAAAPG